MLTFIIIARAVSLLAFAAPLLLTVGGRGPKRISRGERRRGDRTPVRANFAAFGLFFALLAAFACDAEGLAALLLALCGCLLALAGAALVLWSRAELGSAWSLVPMADQGADFVATGPYRLVRHPIYLGLSLLAMGEAVAFGSWPAVVVVFSAIVPTFVWRAWAEERLLADTFGERYAVYRRQTRIIGPPRMGFSLFLLAAALLPLACAGPVRNWRIGEAEGRPLALVRGGPHVDRPSRVWIDTDAACNGGTSDPDDCFAILALIHSPDVEIVGISTVFGNAPLSVVDRTTRDLVGRVAGRQDILVHSGSATALAAGRTISIEPAHAALEHALERGPLTIVGLGPLTNVAATLRRRPDLADSIGLLVLVMGRRPGHVFHPTEGRSSSGILFGHGPIFRDFNFSKDRSSAAIVLGLAERISLTPYAAAREVMVTRRDLARMRRGPDAAAWLAERAGPWLDYWEEDIGLPGFYPFDALAALYVLHPQQFNCAKTFAWIAGDDRLPVPWRVALGSSGLLVGLEADRPRITRASGSVTYCGGVRDGLKDLLLDLLTRQSP
jgi:inosine-uridine nucleoside N-ribohydrolase/protein-S-isoprenylcysteine O-methyltransferase Ste14